MTDFRVTCKKFTCLVQVEDHKIVGGAPIVRKWIGQSFEKFLVHYEVDGFGTIKGRNGKQTNKRNKKKEVLK